MKRLPVDPLVIAALVALALVVRSLFVGLVGLTHDEPFTVYWAHRPLAELFAQLRHENNPPLHFLLVKAILPLADGDVAWLRMPSVVASGLTAWPLFLIGRALGGRLAGFAAVLLFVCSSYQQGFAHEVRAYPLFQLLAVTGVWQLVRVARAAPERPRAALPVLALLNVAMVYTHFFGWLMLGVQALLVLLVPDLRTARRTVALAAGAAAVAYVPYGAVLFDRFSRSVGQGTWLTVPPPEEVYNMLWRWSNAPVLVLLFLAAIAAASARREGRGALWTVGLLWALVPLVGLFVLSQRVPVFLDRYLLFAAPGWCLLTAHALLNALPWRQVGLALAAVGVGGMALSFEPGRGPEGRPERVVAVAQAMGKGRAPVLLIPGWYAHTYAWQVDPALFDHTGSWTDALAARGIHPVDDPLHPPTVAAQADTLVLVDAGARLVDPEQQLEARLSDRLGVPDAVEADRGVRVLRFRH
ncbi:MAG: glycosyltransferase family 39 protein [Flavobacteriales bacterium]|nr:glycosyltransferase family 39 protein [Flavobacteriales bacterium]